MNTSYKLSAMEYGKPGAVHTHNFYRESTKEKFNFAFIGAIVSLQTIKIQSSGAGVSRCNINNLLKRIMPRLMGLILYVFQQMVITSTLIQ
jgi:hypothetical protein